MLFWLTPRETGEGTAALLFGVAVFLVLIAAGIGWKPGRNIAVRAQTESSAA